MRAIIFVLLTHLFFLISLHAQEIIPKTEVTYPQVVIKSNLFYDATTSLNLGLEFYVNKKITIETPININSWTFSNNKKLKHWLFQPEVRFWNCEVFNGVFWGIHLHGGQYNVGGIKLPFGLFPDLEKHRYEGSFYGGGLSCGYQWILSNRWNLELSIGAGYTRLEYNKFKCERCGEKIKEGGTNYLGPDKVALSFIYIIR